MSKLFNFLSKKTHFKRKKLHGNFNILPCGSGKKYRTVAVKTNNTNGLQRFTKSQNMRNSALRYKLGASYKNWKLLINKVKHIFQRFLRSNIENLLLLLYNEKEF